MQITGRTTPGNEAALFMETSGVVRDRLILTLPGYGPENCRSLSACLSAFSFFCHLTQSVFPPLFFLLSFRCCTSIMLYPLPLFSWGFRISCLLLCLSFFLFLSVHVLLSLFYLNSYDVKRLTGSGSTVWEMIVFAGRALLSIYLQCKVRYMPTQQDLRGTCISKEQLSFELVTERLSVFKSWVILRWR